MMTLYDVLGVASAVSAAELRTVYRRLARELHPDQNPGDKAKEARFKDVAYAYSVLSDPERRKRYDRTQFTAAIPLPEIRIFVEQAGATVIDHAATQVKSFATKKLNEQGALGKRAATGVDIILDVAKDWGLGKWASAGKKPPT